MATGSPDYWATRENRMNSIISAMAASIAEGGALVTALDSMDAKLDGVIDLGKLTNDETGLLAKLFTIDTVDGDGKNLLTKLDALDGKVDGQMDLSNLTNDETGLLAKLFTIDTVDADGQNLLTKLDALDGKIDGKMDLDKMELMSIFYNSGTSKTRLEEIVTELNDTVTALTTTISTLANILTSNLTQEEYQRAIYPAGWVVVGPNEELVALYDANRRYFKIHADVNNARDIRIYEKTAADVVTDTYDISPDEVVEKHYNPSKIYARPYPFTGSVGFLWVVY